jgi:hypothetical protein
MPLAGGLLFAELRFSAMTRRYRVWAGAALAVIVPAWLLTVPVSAQQQNQGQSQERGEMRGSGGGGERATPHAGQGPSGGGSATSGSGSESSAGGSSFGYSGGRHDSDGPRRSGATGGDGYAMPRGERPSARPSDGGSGGGGERIGATSGGGERGFRGGSREGVRTGGDRDSDADGVPAYARPREGRNPIGTAVPRGSVPPAAPTGGVYVPGGYYGGGYGYYDPWGYGGYGYGYPGSGGFGGYYGGYYDPWYGGYPAYPQSSYSSTYTDEGSLKLKLKPRDAEVYVDGYFVGVVDDFDGIFQRLRIESGPHRIEVRAPGYEPLTFDVRITPDHTTTYQGELTRLP